ncbi:MAG: nitrite/sulfite reductase [Bacillota bacterium]
MSVKETPAQRVERVKREKAPWSILEDIKRYAREGFDSIPDEDLNIRFKHWGIYTQGDGGGVRGKAVPYLMMRIRTPNGVVTAQQARKVAEVSERFAQSSLDITTRANFQLHWITIEDLPRVWEELESVGLISMGSCGDNTRTVTGCPLSGHEQGEIADTTALTLAVDRHFNGNPAFANLPRKFKMTITGCPHWCTYPEINDVGLTAVRRGEEVGFHIRVGGGLSTRPHMALKLNAFIPWGQVIPVLEAVVAIFRDSDELRINRQKARMKFLFLDHGWTADSFLAEVERRLGYRLDPAVEEVLPEESYRDHVGIHPQKEEGLYYAGFSVPVGRLTPAQLSRIADLADTYGDGQLRLTAMQNILILNLPEANLPAFRAAAGAVGIPLEASPFHRGTISCTGSEYCKLAIVETKRFSDNLKAEMERRFPEFGEQVKLHVTGCPNSCGQHWIADIGLQGVAVNGGDGFDFFLHGGLGAEAAFGRRIGYRAAAADVPDALERLFRAYLATRAPGERFQRWANRVGDEALLRFLEEGLS